MDLADEGQRAEWRRHLGEMFRGRKVIAGLGPLAAFARWVAVLRESGAERPLLLATGLGAGPTPEIDPGDVVMLETGSYPSMTEELRAHDELARNLPAEVASAIDAYDPEREAVWLLGPFVVNEPIDGRPVYGGRPAAWLALEDKLLVEDVWRQAEVPHVGTLVVPVDGVKLREASASLDQGAGVVWAGDARDGFNGGGDFVRWVTSGDDRAAALRFFEPRCDRVRVMPLLEGVPCSIHGIVLPDGTAAFRPVELAIMRGAGRRFVYGGQGTTWDPPASDREAMRDAVRRTGEHLRERVGYRGAFGIDGVLTADGFRPTELNTRMSGGLNTLARAVDEDAFVLLQFASLAGRDPEVTVSGLEEWALTAMDANRSAKAIAISDRRIVEKETEIPVTWTGRELATAEPRAAADATLQVAPTPIGTFCRLVGDVLQEGDRLGPLNAALLRYLDAELGAAFGEVTPAPDVRTVLAP
jgi:hypothetical protein